MAMQNVHVNLSAGFPASSNRCRCADAYSAISPTLASVKTNQEIMIFTDKNKPPNIAIKVQVGGERGWRRASFQASSRHF